MPPTGQEAPETMVKKVRAYLYTKPEAVTIVL
jgi:hypothetical protein